MYALKKYGINVKDRNELNKFVGPPLSDSFQKYYGFSCEESKTAIEYYREYYSKKGIIENLLYDGITTLLKNLKDCGVNLILATSKPGVFAKQILEHFNIDKYFTNITGSNLDGTMIKKDEIIKHIIGSCNIADLSEAIMIGDREYDIKGAKKEGIKSIGVLYGYGVRAELENAGADFIVENPAEIWSIICN